MFKVTWVRQSEEPETIDATIFEDAGEWITFIKETGSGVSRDPTRKVQVLRVPASTVARIEWVGEPLQPRRL